MKLRRAARVETRIEIDARIPASSVAVTVLDISTTGCSIQTDSTLARVGGTIFLKLSDHEGVAGQIVSNDEKRYGVEFYKPVSEETIDWIAAKNK